VSVAGIRTRNPLSRCVRTEQQTPCGGDPGQAGQGEETQSHRRGPRANPRRATGIDELGAPKVGPWRGRLKRVFNVDIETCRECGGAVRIIACIDDPVVIEKILTHLDEKGACAEASRWPRCRAPVGKECRRANIARIGRLEFRSTPRQGDRSAVARRPRWMRDARLIGGKAR